MVAVVKCPPEIVFYDHESFRRLWTVGVGEVSPPDRGSVVNHGDLTYEVLGMRTNTTSAALGRPIYYVYLRRLS